MPEPAKTSKKDAEHPQVVTLRESINQRKDGLKNAKGDEKAALEDVLASEEKALEELTKSLTK